MHAELDCLQHAGRLPAATYKRCTLYITLSPCAMCCGTVLLHNIPHVVVAENTTFTGICRLWCVGACTVLCLAELYVWCFAFDLILENISHCVKLMAPASRWLDFKDSHVLGSVHAFIDAFIGLCLPWFRFDSHISHLWNIALCTVNANSYLLIRR